MAASDSPHIRDEYSPLRTLVYGVLRRFGDFSPESVSGEAASLFLELANDVVTEWNFHPVFASVEDHEVVQQYVSIDEARAIPDVVMRSGLLAYYATQQMSEKAQVYQAQYYMALNREAYKTLTGGINPRLEMTVVR